MSSFWSDILTPGIPVGEKLVRTVIVYAFLILGLRLAGKRELSQLNPFDLVVLLLLSNTVQNAIIGNDNSVVGGLIGAGALLVINSLLVRMRDRYKQLDKIEGKPDMLVRNGRLLRHHLERELITVTELESAARRQGLASLAHVKECRLETGGSLSFVAQTPTDEEMRHHELVTMLAHIETRLTTANERIAALERS
jgi:uncharacterized membrane protein YcaP (DUF421 family)